MRRLGNVFFAEVGKAITLPAVWAGLAVALFGSLAVTALNATMVRSAALDGALDRVADTSAFEAGFAAIPFAGVVSAVIIGVTVVGSEYTADRAEAGGSRQITMTLVAMPQRAALFFAKALLVLVNVAITALAVIPINLLLAQAIIGDTGTESVTTDQAVTRALGAALYWVLMGLIGFAITAFTRSGIVPLIVLISNSSLVSFSLLLTNLTPLAQWLPDMAGRNLFGFSAEYAVQGGLEPLPGAFVMGGWAGALLVIACVVFCRRDA